MKKLLIAAIVLLGFTFSAQAQTAKGVSDNAIGLRLGSNDGSGAEISYQRLMSQKNRLELDLGFYNHNNNSFESSSSTQLTGIYQWLWNIEGGFNWYAGVGANVGTYSWKVAGTSNNEFNLGVVGDIGIEYDFEEAPIQLSLDYRPGVNLVGSTNNGYQNNFALGIRYRF